MELKYYVNGGKYCTAFRNDGGGGGRKKKSHVKAGMKVYHRYRGRKVQLYTLTLYETCSNTKPEYSSKKSSSNPTVPTVGVRITEK